MLKYHSRLHKREAKNVDAITVKKASEADMDSIGHLLTDAFTEEQRIPAQLIPLPSEIQPQWWCAVETDCIVGTVAAWRQGEEIHLGRFAVRVDCRGRHIGLRLMRQAVEDLFGQGFEEIHAEARPAAVKMFCSLGAEICGPDSAFYEGTVTPVILRRGAYRQ